MASGTITDGQISASSEWDAARTAILARLHLPSSEGKLGWLAAENDTNPWLEIDLGSYYTKVTHVATQGRNGNFSQWVKTYKLQFSNNAVNFHYYREQRQTTDKVQYTNP